MMIVIGLLKEACKKCENMNKVVTNLLTTTHVKISQLVASLQTGRQQVVFTRLVTRLFQQGYYNHDITILLQPCVVLLYNDCNRVVRRTL